MQGLKKVYILCRSRGGPNPGTLAITGLKKERHIVSMRRPDMVEMAGVEPASEDQLPRLSTSVAGLLKFPQHSAERQALCLGSLSCMAGVKA